MKNQAYVTFHEFKWNIKLAICFYPHQLLQKG